MFNAVNASSQGIINQVQQVLVSVRDAMDDASRLYAWSSAIALTDLTAVPPDGPGMPEADAQAILNACADAWGLYCLYNTGTDTRNPGAGYNYGASQKIVIGPRTR